MFKIPESFMTQFEIRECSDCGLGHAPIRSCEEAESETDKRTRIFHDFNNQDKDN